MNLDPLTPQARAIRDWLRSMFFATRREEILMSPKDLKREIFLKQGSLPDLYIINAVKELGAERWKDNGKAATRKYSYHRIIETAHDWRLYEFRVSNPGRPFVFRRADFIDDNTWSASAAFELQNKPGREATTRTTMRTREMSKAQLLRQLDNVNGALRAAELMRDEARKERDSALDERDAVQKGVNELDRLYVSVTTRNTELEQQLSEVKADLARSRRDGKMYEKWYHEATEGRDRARLALEGLALSTGRLTEHMEPRELVSMTATDTSN